MSHDIKTAADRIVQKHFVLVNEDSKEEELMCAAQHAIIEVEACIELLNSMSPEFFHHTRNRLNLILQELKSRIA